MRNIKDSSMGVSSFRIHAVLRNCLLLVFLPILLNFGTCTPREERALDDLNRRGVIVTYTLTHQCGTLAVAGNPNVPGPVTHQAGPFAVYTIDTIDNQRPEAVVFDFEASKLFLRSSATSRATNPPRTGGGTRIAPGTMWSTGGRVIIRIDPPSGAFPNPISGLSYELLAGNPPVFIFGRAAPGGIVRQDTCLMNALPSLADLP
ncbi:MAG TPA: hypothetical protein VJR02_04705 [Pyrinomonadaceae bacterium]|nr:hypothetical protein [Pyrinomonadaceae bacterium]